MLAWCRCRLRLNALPLALAGVLVTLVVLLFATDRRLGLHEFASTRYRFHAIPVAISVLYHNRPHDFTAHRNIAMRLQKPEASLDSRIAELIAQPQTDRRTYFWVADDRGLGDYVIATFYLFGPSCCSLSDFYFVLLAGSVVVFIVGYWRTPALFMGPLFVLLGWLAIAQVLLYPAPFANAERRWSEQIALYESRMFDVLALIAVLHIGLLAVCRSTGRLPFWTALPQVALLVFLYHARSSLGWQYLALFSICGTAGACWIVRRIRSMEPPRFTELLGPVFVASLLAVSLAGLTLYKNATYHPDYLTKTFGQRTFWHNALMGLAYHPGLNEELPMPHVEDRAAVEIVLKSMVERDPNLDPNQWNAQSALNSLGNHNSFDWIRYEHAARKLYVQLWRTRTGEMFACYACYKPLDIARQAGVFAYRVANQVISGLAWELVAGGVLAVVGMIAFLRAARQDPSMQVAISGLLAITAGMIPFSLIPGIAFYPAITTIACFYLLTGTTIGLLVVRLSSRVKEAA